MFPRHDCPRVTDPQGATVIRKFQLEKILDYTYKSKVRPLFELEWFHHEITSLGDVCPIQFA